MQSQARQGALKQCDVALSQAAWLRAMQQGLSHTTWSNAVQCDLSLCNKLLSHAASSQTTQCGLKPYSAVPSSANCAMQP